MYRSWAGALACSPALKLGRRTRLQSGPVKAETRGFLGSVASQSSNRELQDKERHCLKGSRWRSWELHLRFSRAHTLKSTDYERPRELGIISSKALFHFPTSKSKIFWEECVKSGEKYLKKKVKQNFHYFQHKPGYLSLSDRESVLLTQTQGLSLSINTN